MRSDTVVGISRLFRDVWNRFPHHDSQLADADECGVDEVSHTVCREGEICLASILSCQRRIIHDGLGPNNDVILNINALFGSNKLLRLNILYLFLQLNIKCWVTARSTS